MNHSNDPRYGGAYPPQSPPAGSPYGGGPTGHYGSGYPPQGPPPYPPAPRNNNTGLLIGIIAVLALVIVVGAILFFTGVLGGGRGAAANNAAMAAPNSTPAEISVPSPSSGNDAMAATTPSPTTPAEVLVARAVAQMQTRLPLRDGPVTLQQVTASFNTDRVTMTGTTTLSLDTGADWQRMNAALQTSVCVGPLGRFIPQTITVSTDMTDARGQKGSNLIMSCDRSTSGNPYYRNPSLK